MSSFNYINCYKGTHHKITTLSLITEFQVLLRLHGHGMGLRLRLSLSVDLGGRRVRKHIHDTYFPFQSERNGNTSVITGVETGKNRIKEKFL